MSTIRSCRLALLSLSLILLHLILGCAEIEAPSGGPIDKTGPKGLAAFPADGTLEYSGTPEFTFQFDEHIDERTVASSLIITPRPLTPPEIRTRGKQVIIRLNDSLRDETTYLVALSPSMKDLRGNQLSEQVAIRFSTGRSIDTGRIVGRVLEEGKTLAGVVVVAYPLTDGKITGDTLKPMYRSVTAGDGLFHLDVLPSGEYVTVAFVDADRDEIPNQVTEQIGVADRIVNVAADLPPPNLTIWIPPKNSTLIPSIRQVGNGLLRLSGIYDSIRSDQITLKLTRNSIPASHSLRKDKFVGGYLIEFPASDTGDAEVSIIRLTDTVKLQVRILVSKDTKSPEFWISRPTESWGQSMPDSIVLTFSEPMDTTTEVSLSGLGRDSLASLTFAWVNKYTAATRPKDSVLLQRWKVSRLFPRDEAGNELLDTLLSIPYRVVSADSLGSISGILTNITDDSIWIRVYRLNQPETTSFFLPNNRFDFQLPSGRYGLEAFTDRTPTVNGTWTHGTLNPLRLAEPRYQFIDTLTVRARFEVTGLSLRPFVPVMSNRKSISVVRGSE